MHVEYPKALYLRGWDDLDAMITVYDAEQEAEAREDGYRSLAEPLVVLAVRLGSTPMPDGPEKDAVAALIAGGVRDAPEEPKRRGRPPKAISE